jgi:hypothetical protein
MKNTLLPEDNSLGDGLAVSLSALCLAHCLLLPVLAGVIPLFSTVVHTPWIHAVLFATAAPLSIWVLGKGWQLHRQIVPVAAGTAGLVLLALGMMHSAHLPSERLASVSGALLLALAHGTNIWIRWRKPKS